MRRSLFLALPLLFVLSLSACADGKITMRSFDGKNVVTMNVEFADTPEEREQGLMNRDSLDPEKGMLFVFPSAAPLTFWMRNTTIPLEIMFFDAQGDFVNSYAMEPCIEEPCTTYTSASISQYALEVVPGFRTEKGIGVGWRLDLDSVAKNAKPR